MKTIMLLTVVALVLAACGDDGATVPSVPDDPDEVILTVTSEGGFMPVEANLERMPRYVVTADGTLYYVGPTTLEYPGPMLPNVQVTTMDQATLDEVLSLVADLGLPELEEEVVDDSGSERIADASTEFITYFDETGEHRMGFYALGVSEEGSTERLLANEIVEFLDQAAASGESEPYRGDRLQVAAGPPVEAEPGMGSVKEWPLSVSFDEMDEWAMDWRCIEVSGEEASELFDVFSDANQATTWDTGEQELGIRARPLLPGENACGGAPAGG